MTTATDIVMMLYLTYISPTTDYIEVKVCGDEGTNSEDVPVNY